MGVLCDYFASGSDEGAAALVDAAGQIPGAVAVTGIDPVVQMGMLEALLTGRDYDELDAERPDGTVAERDGGERLVIRLPAGLTEALAAASDERLAEVAVPWSETEEFWGEGDPGELAAFLRALAALAREGRPLYSRMSV